MAERQAQKGDNMKPPKRTKEQQEAFNNMKREGWQFLEERPYEAKIFVCRYGSVRVIDRKGNISMVPEGEVEL